MVTAVTLAATAGPSQPAAGTTPQLSDFAQNTLDSITRMQSEFVSVKGDMMQATSSPASTATAANQGAQPVNDTAQMIAALRESNAAAIKVQQQMYQFTMASSVSSSLSTNLNSFLKGS